MGRFPCKWAGRAESNGAVLMTRADSTTSVPVPAAGLPPPVSAAERDHALVERFVRGEADAFDELVELYREQVTRLAYRLLGWSADAEDVVQEVFLAAVRRSEEPVTMFLVNGVMLQGEIAAFDLFCMLLKRDGLSQLVYKHAISTVQPEHPVNLNESAEESGS